MILSLAILTEYQQVTHTQTQTHKDTWRQHILHYYTSIASCSKNESRALNQPIFIIFLSFSRLPVMRYKKVSLSKFFVRWYAISTTWWLPCSSAASPRHSQQSLSSSARAASNAIFNKTSEFQQVLPKVIWEEYVTTQHNRECTRLLRVLAVQCPLQTSAVLVGMLHPYHISPLTHRPLTLTFTLTLLTVLIPVQCRLVFYRLEGSSRTWQN